MHCCCMLLAICGCIHPHLESRPVRRPNTASVFDVIFQADGGIKKGRAAFGDLTNHSQGQVRQLSDPVRKFGPIMLDGC